MDEKQFNLPNEADTEAGFNSQLAALTSQLGLGDTGEEDQIDEAEVSSVVNDILKSVKQEEQERSARRKSREQKRAARTVLSNGLALATQAVEADGAGKYGKAAQFYDKSVEYLSQSLGTLGDDTKASIIGNVVGYLDRVSVLLQASPAQEPDNDTVCDEFATANSVNKARRATYEHLNKAGFSVLSRGVHLRKMSQAAHKEGKTWSAFVLLSESLDAFVAYMKVDPKGGKNDALKKAVIDSLDVAEELKEELKLAKRRSSVDQGELVKELTAKMSSASM